MNEIIKKTQDLIDALEKSDIIKNLLSSKEKLLKDEDLLSLIKKAQKAKGKELILLKKRLYKNNDYYQYMDSYNKLYYLVLKINTSYQKITEGKKCQK